MKRTNFIFNQEKLNNDLALAIEDSDLDAVELLLSEGADPADTSANDGLLSTYVDGTASGEKISVSGNALHFAILLYDNWLTQQHDLSPKKPIPSIEKLKSILSALLNKDSGLINSTTSYGQTALHFAYDLNIIEHLLSFNPELDVPDKSGINFILRASAWVNIPGANYPLTRDCFLNVSDKALNQQQIYDGSTVLHVLANYQHDDIIRGIFKPRSPAIIEQLLQKTNFWGGNSSRSRFLSRTFVYSPDAC